MTYLPFGGTFFSGVVMPMLVGVLLYFATMALARVTPLSSADVAAVAGATPATRREAAAVRATATMDLRMDLSSSRGLRNPSPLKVHARPRNGK